MKGFIDESGTENTSEYLAISLVVFESDEDLQKLRNDFCKLRGDLGLSKNFEFHRAHNSAKIKAAVEKILKSTSFSFYSILVRKERRSISLNYEYLAKELITEMTLKTEKMEIKLDSNPMLHRKLRKVAKEAKISRLRISEAESQKYDGLQVADYIVNISRHKVEKKYGRYKYQRLFEKCKRLCIIEP